jgi:pimeloyl-ACP methyl ester carboxylesterase
MSPEPALTDKQTLDLDSVQISYWQWPRGDQPLLLLHGLADHGLVWRELAIHLDGFHSVAPDLRGHGDSSKPETGYSCLDIIADLEALMAALEWDSAHIVAHSWAAKIALMWARQHPARSRTLTLVDPFFVNRFPAFTKITFPLLYRVLPFLKVMGPFNSYADAEELAKGLKQYRGWSPFQADVFHMAMEQKADGSWGSKFVAQARNQVFDDMLRTNGLTEPLAIPTLLLLPDAGLNRFDWQLRPYYQCLTQLETKSIPGNHWPFLVEPGEFQSAIADFLHQHLK